MNRSIPSSGASNSTGSRSPCVVIVTPVAGIAGRVRQQIVNRHRSTGRVSVVGNVVSDRIVERQRTALDQPTVSAVTDLMIDPTPYNVRTVAGVFAHKSRDPNLSAYRQPSASTSARLAPGISSSASQSVTCCSIATIVFDSIPYPPLLLTAVNSRYRSLFCAGLSGDLLCHPLTWWHRIHCFAGFSPVFKQPAE